MKKFNWIFAVLLASIVGYCFAPWLTGINKFTFPLLFITMFLLGLEIDFSELTKSLKNYKAILFTIPFVFVIGPLLGLLLSSLFISNKDLNIGLMTMVSVSGTIAPSIIWTRLSGGNSALSFALVLINTFLSSIFTPIALHLLIGFQVPFNLTDLITTLGLSIILPVIIAQLVKGILTTVLKSYGTKIPYLTRGILLVFIAFAVASTASFVSLQPVLQLLPVVVIHHIAMAGICFHLAKKFGFNFKDRIAMTFAASQNAFIPAVCILSLYLPGIAMLAPLVYHLFQESIAGVFVHYFHKFQPR